MAKTQAGRPPWSLPHWHPWPPWHCANMLFHLSYHYTYLTAALYYTTIYMVNLYNYHMLVSHQKASSVGRCLCNLECVIHGSNLRQRHVTFLNLVIWGEKTRIRKYAPIAFFAAISISFFSLSQIILSYLILSLYVMKPFLEKSG